MDILAGLWFLLKWGVVLAMGVLALTTVVGIGLIGFPAIIGVAGTYALWTSGSTNLAVICFVVCGIAQLALIIWMEND